MPYAMTLLHLSQASKAMLRLLASVLRLATGSPRAPVCCLPNQQTYLT